MTPAGPDPTTPSGLDARLTIIETILPDLFEMYESRAEGGPYIWAKLSSVDAEKLWKELGDFVSWLDAHYLVHLNNPGLGLPACWYRHPIAVEELTALMVSHRAVYVTRSAVATSALVDWHQRSLWPTLDSLRQNQVFNGCRSKEGHRDSRFLPASFVVDSDYLHGGPAGR
ncbi:MAG: hypothetical protein LH624_03535 [Cryobacterium sp.]|nr:hypothetical protein [Cryobacterium sp.]